MKRTLVTLFAATMAASILGSVAAAPSTKPPPKSNSTPAPKKTPGISKYRLQQLELLKVSAPGDEYFGRMKMSYLGVDNEFHDDLIRAGAYTTDPHLISKIAFADEALQQWYSKYPKDPQLPRAYYLGYEMYAKVYTKDGQDRALQLLRIIIARWPSSWFGKALQKDLQSYTEHYFASPEPCPSAAPVQYITDRRGHTVAITPTATPTEQPTPTPSPAPGQPNIEILPTACVSMTPSPEPAASATAAPQPASSLSPAPRATRTPR